MAAASALPTVVERSCSETGPRGATPSCIMASASIVMGNVLSAANRSMLLSNEISVKSSCAIGSASRLATSTCAGGAFLSSICPACFAALSAVASATAKNGSRSSGLTSPGRDDGVDGNGGAVSRFATIRGCGPGEAAGRSAAACRSTVGDWDSVEAGERSAASRLATSGVCGSGGFGGRLVTTSAIALAGFCVSIASGFDGKPRPGSAAERPTGLPAEQLPRQTIFGRAACPAERFSTVRGPGPAELPPRDPTAVGQPVRWSRAPEPAVGWVSSRAAATPGPCSAHRGHSRIAPMTASERITSRA